MLVHRLELIRDPEWKTYAERDEAPVEGDRVFVQYSYDNKWYRGRVDEVKQVTAVILYIDMHNLAKGSCRQMELFHRLM